MTTYHKYSEMSGGKIDGSIGTIFRLNFLWNKVDAPAAEGDFDKWDFWLDRIFCNLCFKEPFEITEDDNTGKIVKVEFNEKDKRLIQHLNFRVKHARNNLTLAKRNKNFSGVHKANKELYDALMLKDIGLRKYEHQVLKLYMKETDSNPARAMWGG
jgi:hypothetical protein